VSQIVGHRTCPSVPRPLLNSYKLKKLEDACAMDAIIPEIIETNQIKKITDKNEILYEILSRNTGLYVDGCDYFLSSLTTGYGKRSVETPQVESVISGPHEAFNETLKTNISLVILGSILNFDYTMSTKHVGKIL
jgi:spore germination protein KA